MASRPPRQPRALGALIALLVIVGTIGGGLLGQPSAGLLIGAAIGIAVAVAFWAIDRRR